MKVNKKNINKSLLSNMTEEQRKVYEFIESNISPAYIPSSGTCFAPGI